MIKIIIPLHKKANSDLIKDWVNKVNTSEVYGELNPNFGEYGTAIHYLMISNICNSNIAIQYQNASVEKDSIIAQIDFEGDYSDRLFELQQMGLLVYKPRGIVIEVPTANVRKTTIVTFDIYVQPELLNRDSKESLKSEADHWIVTAKQEAKLWRQFF